MTTFAEKLETIFMQSFDKGCRIIRRAEFLEEIEYIIGRERESILLYILLCKHIIYYYTYHFVVKWVLANNWSRTAHLYSTGGFHSLFESTTQI